MAFEPFGYRFDLRTPMSLADTKAAVRARKKKWFDTKDGARGWIIGPFICLWMTALSSRGPMLLGWVSRYDLTTRVRGRAGSDLNGLLWVSFILILLAVMILRDGANIDWLSREWWIIPLFLVLIPLVFWFKHQERHEAEPLVRFLQDAVTVSGKSLRANSASLKLAKAITMDVNGKKQSGPLTMDAIHDALLSTGMDDFVILEAGPEHYIQSAMRDGAFVIETREGNRDRHFQAVRREPASATSKTNSFTFEEVLAAFVAYASDAPMPHLLKWEPLESGL